jgi:6-pyruvoyltetrahydropterin/6-carboxytetrahydropterin synthase
MAATYTLKIVIDFAASHILVGHPGKCARLHGHNWKVEVEARARKLDDLGMAIDFQDLKTETRELIETLDHRHLNDLEPFRELNPTAENLASYVYRALSERLNDERVRISAVTIWETERACVRYTEED